MKIAGDDNTVAPLRERASQDHIALEIEPTADGTRLAWSLPLNSGPTAG